MKKQKIFAFIAVMTILLGTIVTFNLQPASANTSPKITANLTKNWVIGEGWLPGDSVSLTINDPATLDSPDFSSELDPDPEGKVIFELGDAFFLKPEDHVEMTNGTVTREHTIFGFIPTGFDTENETISGRAQPGSLLHVRVHWDEEMVGRDVIASESGEWIADFGNPGEQEWEVQTIDLTQRSIGYIYQVDPDEYDFDQTMRVVPVRMDAHIGTFGGHKIETNNWQIGESVYVEIDDPNTTTAVDFSDTFMPSDGPGAVTGGGIELEGWDIQPGQTIKLSQGELVKTQVVADPQIKEINYLDDTVSGMAHPGAEVIVSHQLISGKVVIRRLAYADEMGNWQVDFSNEATRPAETGDPLDIKIGMFIDVHESDQDADTTNIRRPVSMPIVIGIKTLDHVWAINYPKGTNLTLWVDDTSTAKNPDYTATQVVTDLAPSRDLWLTSVEFELPKNKYLQTGTVVTITGPEVVKQVTLTPVKIAAVDMDADQVYGFAEPDTKLYVRAENNETTRLALRYTQANENGYWTVDFSKTGSLPLESEVADLSPETNVYAQQTDADGDRTYDFWSYQLNDGFVTGGGWINSPEGAYYPQDLPFYDGSYYELFDAAEIPWADANDLVDQLTNPTCTYPHLATVTTAEEDQFLVDTFGKEALFGKWLGGLQSPLGEEPDGGWGWVTGESWDYENWNDGEPNDAGGNEDHLEYWNNGMWNDEGYLPLVTGYLVEYDDCYLPTGKANFGFVSKYKKGATTPDGNTEFQFHAADLNFHSTSYDWLVVTGSDYARFKGTGTINGEGEYKFMIWAGDSEQDTFRIRIWQEDEFGVETDVYDNGFDQEIGGGNIVVHTK